MRCSHMVLLVAALSAFGTSIAKADPLSDLNQMGKAFAALHSVHADITTQNGMTMSMDMVQPDKYRANSRGMQMVRIGTTAWVNIGGTWQTIPVPAMAQTQAELARTASFNRNTLKNYRITDAGMDTVRGIAAHKYHIVSKKDRSTLDIWAANNLPVRITVRNATIDYSQYNRVPDIKAPI